MAAEKKAKQTPPQADDKKKAYRPYPKKTDEKRDGVPMLRFGKGNNFFKFRKALAEACLKEYGHLGRLIEEEKAYLPVFAQFVAPPGSTLDADEEKVLKVKAVKEYAKKLAKVEAESPKMYISGCFPSANVSTSLVQETGILFSLYH